MDSFFNSHNIMDFQKNTQKPIGCKHTKEPMSVLNAIKSCTPLTLRNQMHNNFILVNLYLTNYCTILTCFIGHSMQHEE